MVKTFGEGSHFRGPNPLTSTVCATEILNIRIYYWFLKFEKPEKIVIVRQTTLGPGSFHAFKNQTNKRQKNLGLPL